MKNYTVDELNSLLELYLLTCDDQLKYEDYDTTKEFAENHVSKFLLWIKENETE